MEKVGMFFYNLQISLIGQKQKSYTMKISAWLISFVAWLQIVAFPLFLGLIIYRVYPNTIGLVFGIAIAILGLVVGVIFATRVWKKRGTIDFISRVSASPELDNLDEVEK